MLDISFFFLPIDFDLIVPEFFPESFSDLLEVVVFCCLYAFHSRSLLLDNLISSRARSLVSLVTEKFLGL